MVIKNSCLYASSAIFLSFLVVFLGVYFGLYNDTDRYISFSCNNTVEGLKVDCVNQTCFLDTKDNSITLFPFDSTPLFIIFSTLFAFSGVVLILAIIIKIRTT
jgi:hypothetical protein